MSTIPQNEQLLKYLADLLVSLCIIPCSMEIEMSEIDPKGVKLS